MKREREIKKNHTYSIMNRATFSAGRIFIGYIITDSGESRTNIRQPVT
jgi:hypothetical protein